MNKLTLHKLAIHLTAVLACGVVTLSIAAAQRARVTFDGEYAIRRSAMADEGRARIAAIQRAVGEIEPASAKRWEGMLDAMTTPQGKLRIHIALGEIAITEGERPALKSAASGAERAVNDYTQLAQRVEGDALIKRVVLETLNGRTLPAPLSIVTRHTLSADRQTLVLQTRVEGGELTQPIDLSATYDRI